MSEKDSEASNKFRNKDSLPYQKFTQAVLDTWVDSDTEPKSKTDMEMEDSKEDMEIEDSQEDVQLDKSPVAKDDEMEIDLHEPISREEIQDVSIDQENDPLSGTGTEETSVTVVGCPDPLRFKGLGRGEVIKRLRIEAKLQRAQVSDKGDDNMSREDSDAHKKYKNTDVLPANEFGLAAFDVWVDTDCQTSSQNEESDVPKTQDKDASATLYIRNLFQPLFADDVIKSPEEELENDKRRLSDLQKQSLEEESQDAAMLDKENDPRGGLPGLRSPEAERMHLFNRIIERHDIKAVADDWRQLFLRSRPRSLQQMLELIMNVCGFFGEISTDQMLELLNEPDMQRKCVTLDSWLHNQNYLPCSMETQAALWESLDRFIECGFTDQVLVKKSFMTKLLNLIQIFNTSKYNALRNACGRIGARVIKIYVDFVVNRLDRTALEDREFCSISNLFEFYCHETLQCLRDKDMHIRDYIAHKLRDWLVKCPQIFMKKYFLQHLFQGFKIVNMRLYHLETTYLVIMHEYWNENRDKLCIFVEAHLKAIRYRCYDRSATVRNVAMKVLCLAYRLTTSLRIKKFLCSLVFRSCALIASNGANFLRDEICKTINDEADFIVELTKYAHTYEEEIDALVDKALVKVFMESSQDLLYDWHAWRRFLLAYDHVQVLEPTSPLFDTGCRILLSVVEYIRWNMDDAKLRVSYTEQLGSMYSELFRKFMFNRSVIKSLIKIPKLFTSKILHEPTLEEIVKLLTCLSGHEIETLDNAVESLKNIYDLCNRYKYRLEVVDYINRKVVSKTFEYMGIAVKCFKNDKGGVLTPFHEESLKKVAVVAKHFDVTTEFTNAALTLMRYVFENVQVALGRHMINIVQYIAENMLRSARDSMSAGAIDVTRETLLKLKPYTEKIFTIFQAMLHRHYVHQIKMLSYIAMTNLTVLLNRNNSYVRDVSQIVDICIDLSVRDAEWLGYLLAIHVNYNRMPRYDENYGEKCFFLDNYCVLLHLNSLNMQQYMCRILVYLNLFFEDNNYNGVLEEFFRKSLKCHPNMRFLIVVSLDYVWRNERNSDAIVQRTAVGLTQLLLTLEQEKERSLIFSVVREAVMYADRMARYGFLNMIVPMAYFLTAEEKLLLWVESRGSLDRVFTHTESRELKQVLEKTVQISRAKRNRFLLTSRDWHGLFYQNVRLRQLSRPDPFQDAIEESYNTTPRRFRTVTFSQSVEVSLFARDVQESSQKSSPED